MRLKTKLMDEMTMQRTLIRIAHEILEKNRGAENLCIVGIRRRGERLAELIAENIKKIEGVEVPCGSMDISFYRDDLSMLAESPVLKKTELPFAVTGRDVIVVDDVLFTGRTVRAAIEGIFACGRPQSIQLAILIDRGHRQLPLRADYVGKNIPTSLTETVAVNIVPYDEENAVLLFENEI